MPKFRVLRAEKIWLGYLKRGEHDGSPGCRGRWSQIVVRVRAFRVGDTEVGPGGVKEQETDL